MAFSFNKKVWGTYNWNDQLTVAQNVTAAIAASALIRTVDLQKLEDALEAAASNSAEVDTALATKVTKPTAVSGTRVVTHTNDVASTMIIDASPSNGSLARRDNSGGVIVPTGTPAADGNAVSKAYVTGLLDKKASIVVLESNEDETDIPPGTPAGTLVVRKA